jgi:uncharacterized delta-60 repeat protein
MTAPVPDNFSSQALPAGIIITDIGTGSADNVQAVALQGDGKILIAGSTEAAFGQPDYFALVRYKPDGTLDTTFNSTGKVVSAVSADGFSVCVQADGKILIAGFAATDAHNFIVQRYNTNGSLDITFNGTGTVLTGVGSGTKYDGARSMSPQADGKIVVAGSSLENGSQDFAVMRYNADGSLDTSFNGTGKVLTDLGTSSGDFANSVKVQADGKIVVVGASTPSNVTLMNGSVFDIAVVRYNTDGSLDTSFNATGKLTTDLGSNSNDNAYSAALQSDGKILVGGYSGSDFAVVRYNSDGSLDTGFNGTGKVVTDFAGGSFDSGASIALQANGKIVVAGTTNTSGGLDEFAVARYNADGSLDTSFNGTGKVSTGVAALNGDGTGVTVQGDGKIVVAGVAFGGGTSNPGDFVVVRYNADGSLDTSFDGVNSAPVLNTSASPAFPSVLAGATNPAGISVASLVVDDSIADADGAVEAIAITGVNASLGAWQYSIDGGAHWLTIEADEINSTTNELALLLGPTAMVRLLPFGDLKGSLASGLTFRAWDQSSGSEGQYAVIGATGGTTAFSTASDTAAIAVGSANHAPTFSPATGTGQVTWGYGFAESVLVQPDGKLVVAGTASVGAYGEAIDTVRLNADGSLDATFAETGSAVVDPGGYLDSYGRVCALQPDGKILVAGRTSSGISHATVVRYNADGSLDTTFNKTGIWVSPSASTDQAWTLAVRVDGKIVLAGGTYSADSANMESFATWRLNSDGSADTTFNATGGVTTGFGSDMGEIRAIAVQPDGKVLVAGEAWTNPSSRFALARYNVDGSLDTSFNGSGHVETVFGTAAGALEIVLLADGKFLAAGTSDSLIALARYNSDGSLDSTFNGSGKLVLNINLTTFGISRCVDVLPDGKIVVTGWTDSSQTGFAVARYNADGSVDTTFNGNGQVVTHLPYRFVSFDAAVEPDGKTVVVGQYLNDLFMAMRYNADGSLDTSFGGNPAEGVGGTVVYAPGNAPVRLDDSAVVYDRDLATLASGAGNYAGASITLHRDGSPDIHDQFFAQGNLKFIAGNAVLSGVTVGSVTNGAGQLSIAFNGNATQARVNEVLSDFAYTNNSDTPPSSVLVDYVFNDGNAGAQGPGGALTASGAVTVNIDPSAAAQDQILTGTANSDLLNGGAGNDMISGLAGGDTLFGWGGDDTLMGGTGNDAMDGGEGSDLYVVSTSSEHVVAEIGDTGTNGTDEVRFAAASSGTLTLFAGDTGIERVVIGTGTDPVANSAATTALNVNAAAVGNALWIVGNAGANTLTGTAFNDTLDGGAGTDKMAGGNGNDTYFVDNAADSVTEASAAGGIDVVLASVSYTLGSNLENLVLTGSAAINGTGNALANVITGNGVRNVIDGKAGVDAMNGGEGGDLYVVGVSTDHTAAEFADSGSGGVDEVRFAATKASTLTLFAGDTGIEQVTIGTGTGLTAVTTGTAALNVNAAAVGNALTITGNGGVNILVGTAFNDTLSGGKGSDLLTGGGGADAFVFNFAPNASSNKDTITDFMSGTDVLQLSKAIYTAITGAPGGLTTEQFWAAAGATVGHDADDRIIYNTTTGVLYYDADGSGSGSAVQIALLGTSAHPALAYTDIALIA